MGIKANSYAEAEAEVNAMLETIKAEEIVDRMWFDRSPRQIAQHIRAIHRGIPQVTARWVESIKRRIDRKARED